MKQENATGSTNPEDVDGQFSENSFKELSVKHRELKERYFMARKELREMGRLIKQQERDNLQLEDLKKGREEFEHRLAREKESVAKFRGEGENLKNELGQARLALKNAHSQSEKQVSLLPLLEKERDHLLQVVDQSEKRIQDLVDIQEQLEYEVAELGREQENLLSRVGKKDGEIGQGLQTVKELHLKNEGLATSLKKAEDAIRKNDEALKVLHDNLVESGDEILDQEQTIQAMQDRAGNLETELEEEKTSTDRQLEQLEVRLEDVLDEKAGLKKRLEDLQARNSTGITTLISKHAKESKSAQNEHAKRQVLQLQAHSKEMDSLKQDYSRQLAKVNSEKKFLQAELEAKQEDLTLLEERLQTTDSSVREAGKLAEQLLDTLNPIHQSPDKNSQLADIDNKSVSPTDTDNPDHAGILHG